MGSEIIVALITGAVSLIGTIFTILATSKKTDENMKIHIAVTDAKIEELTREVRAHNGFAQRLPVVEEKIAGIDKRLSKVESKKDDN